MTKEEIFRNIASKTSGKDCNYLPGCCPDQYVGIVEKLKPEENFHRENIFKGDTKNIEKDFSACEHVIILILESPHTDEFDKNGDPIGPANGPTGRNIREHIAKIFPNFSDYHLILMNAIPFQCSLGVATEHFRDNVFKAAWDDDKVGAGFFEDRLKKLLYKLQKNSKNVVIVNACTIATDKNFEDLHCMACKIIQDVIQDVMKKNKFALTFYHTVHPSSWHWCRKNYKLNDSKRNVNERCQNRRKCKQSQIQIVKN